MDMGHFHTPFHTWIHIIGTHNYGEAVPSPF
jgi:hypothetical protein